MKNCHFLNVVIYLSFTIRKHFLYERITAMICMQYEQSLFTFEIEAQTEFVIVVEVHHSSRFHLRLLLSVVLWVFRFIGFIISRLRGKVK